MENKLIVTKREERRDKFQKFEINRYTVSVYVLSHLSHVRLLPPYGPQPARLLCPWDSPGKNTGVSCLALLQGIFPIQGLKQVSYVSCVGECVPTSVTGKPADTSTIYKRDTKGLPEIILPTSVGSQKKQESYRKISTSALLTTPKHLTVWITTNYGKFLKRWEYQGT